MTWQLLAQRGRGCLPYPLKGYEDDSMVFGLPFIDRQFAGDSFSPIIWKWAAEFAQDVTFEMEEPVRGIARAHRGLRKILRVKGRK